MTLWDSLAQGFIAGTGMFIASVIWGVFTFKLMKPWVVKMLTDVWSTVRTSGLEVEVKIDGDTKKKQ